MRISILTFLCFSFVSYSQVVLKGVISSNDTVLSNVLVEVYSTHTPERITYTITDKRGRYELSLNKGTYSFKLSHIAYFTAYHNYEISNSQQLDFSLEENPQIISEVAVESRALDLFVNGDTTTYNLNKLTNGTEESLKDVLEKLPGIDVDENGKILSNGKKIDKLLIDGNEFFGEQHQLATENLSSEMIAGVSKLENYQDVFSLNSDNPSGLTALNINIDEDYKGQLKGEIEAHSGYRWGLKESYHCGANAYSFREKTNLFFIANTNNLGKQTFTIEDYISFQGGLQKLAEQSSQSFGSIHFSIPEFLFSDKEVKSKNDHLGALNFSYTPSKKWNVNSHFILNNINTVEKQLISQQFFNNQINTISNTKNNSFLVNNSFIELKYKLSSVSILNYTTHFSPKRSDLFNNDLFNSKQFFENRDQQGISINQNLAYKRKLGKKSRLSTSLYYNLNTDNNTLFITSGESFIDSIFNESYEFNEDINSRREVWGLNTLVKTKISDYLFTEITHKASINSAKFSSSTYQNRVELRHEENQLGLRLFKRDKSFFNYELGANYSRIIRNALSPTTHLLPYTSLRFNFNQSHNLSIDYKHQVEYVKAKHLVLWPYVVNYNTLNANQDIQDGDFASYHKFNLNYHISDQFSGTYAVVGCSYSKGENTPTINTIPFLNGLTNYFTTSPSEQEYNSYLLIEKNFYKLPLSIESRTTISSAQQTAYIEGKEELSTTQSFGTQLLFTSRFKNPVFNVEAAYKFNLNKIVSYNNPTSTQVATLSPYVNLLFSFNNLKAQINTTFRKYESQNHTIQRLYISPSLKYHKNKSKWEFSLRGNDILNLNNNEIFRIENQLSYIEEKTISIMGGYVIAGIGFKF